MIGLDEPAFLMDGAAARDGCRFEVADVAMLPRPRALADVKATSYLVASVARRRAHAAGADEALLVDGSEVYWRVPAAT